MDAFRRGKLGMSVKDAQIMLEREFGVAEAGLFTPRGRLHLHGGGWTVEVENQWEDENDEGDFIELTVNTAMLFLPDGVEVVVFANSSFPGLKLRVKNAYNNSIP